MGQSADVMRVFAHVCGCGCLSVYLSIPSCHLSIYLSIYFFYQSVYLSIYLSTCLSTYLSICLSIYICAFFLSFFLSICLSIYPSISRSIDLSIYPTIYLSIYPSFLFMFMHVHIQSLRDMNPLQNPTPETINPTPYFAGLGGPLRLQLHGFRPHRYVVGTPGVRCNARFGVEGLGSVITRLMMGKR